MRRDRDRPRGVLWESLRLLQGQNSKGCGQNLLQRGHNGDGEETELESIKAKTEVYDLAFQALLPVTGT